MLSRTHALARRLRALKNDAKLRDAEGVVVAEGVHLAIEALRAGAAIEAAVSAPRLMASEEGRALADRIGREGVRLETTSDTVLASLQDARSPQPIVLIVRRDPVGIDAVISGRGAAPLIVAACGVQEPGNLGALWRTADAAGATGFVATPGSAGLTHPRTVRASMGAIFRLPGVEVGIEELIYKVNSSKLRVYGAEASGGDDYDRVDWRGPIALLFGGEGQGLPVEALQHLEARVRIPMARGVESLSVNAAAAVMLFEAARARRAVSRDE